MEGESPVQTNFPFFFLLGALYWVSLRGRKGMFQTNTASNRKMFFNFFLPCLALSSSFLVKKKGEERENKTKVTDHGRVGLLESAA
jgi:hypothetical protein